MAYLGGKSTVYEHIIKILNDKRYDGYDYIEPFCGYCHILRRVKNKQTYSASDECGILISLLKRIQEQKLNFPRLTKAKYEELKRRYRNGVLKQQEKCLAGLAAFCYSYNGKEFGGYTPKSEGRNYVQERLNYYKRLSKNEVFQKAKIEEVRFENVKPKKKCLIYCDPPYANTTTYGKATFDSKKFWEDCRRLIKRGNIVYVSEYNAPSDFYVVSKATKYSTVGGKGSTGTVRVEKLFKHKSQRHT